MEKREVGAFSISFVTKTNKNTNTNSNTHSHTSTRNVLLLPRLKIVAPPGFSTPFVVRMQLHGHPCQQSILRPTQERRPMLCWQGYGAAVCACSRHVLPSRQGTAQAKGEGRRQERAQAAPKQEWHADQTGTARVPLHSSHSISSHPTPFSPLVLFICHPITAHPTAESPHLQRESICSCTLK
jgi:hypothetical protein